MPKFTTRVELHDATEDDYAELHAAMETEGFSRLIEDNKGNVCHLPWAEYNSVGEETRDQVLAAAKRGAKLLDVNTRFLSLSLRGALGLTLFLPNKSLRCLLPSAANSPALSCRVLAL